MAFILKNKPDFIIDCELIPASVSAFEFELPAASNYRKCTCCWKAVETTNKVSFWAFIGPYSAAGLKRIFRAIESRFKRQ